MIIININCNSFRNSGCFSRGEVVRVTPNPQHGGPGAVFRLVPPLIPLRRGFSRLVTDNTRVLEIKQY